MGQHPVIKVENLWKIYNLGEVKVEALRGISFEVTAGEFIAVMGPSGSGKTTLMNILGCLDRPTQGHYFLDGQEVSKLSQNELAHVRNKKIGFVFQNFNLLPRLTALQNVELPLIYADLPPQKRKERAEEVLRSVNLAERAHHYPNQLSGGQQQRVAIARALVNDPPLILADEPTGNLDTHSSEEIMQILQKLNQQGKTIILITHERDIAEHCRRVLHFRDGQIVDNETVEQPIKAEIILSELLQEEEAVEPV
ncbi:MAG: putative transport system ATP-binding protein [Candidatus Atribacteria bacterium]|nr:putative transport system ATP-binding protein [Candidatus Atribacteria bacterium]